MMQKTLRGSAAIVGIVVLALLVLGACAPATSETTSAPSTTSSDDVDVVQQTEQQQSKPVEKPESSESTEPAEESSQNVESASEETTSYQEVKEFFVESYQFGYEPDIVEVNVGDKVKITTVSRDVPHSILIPEYDINLYSEADNENTIEFVADQPGTFTWHCGVPCGPGHRKMKGQLVVIE